MKKIVGLLAMLNVSAALAGGRVGNGGDGVVCRDSNKKIVSIELLDFYERKLISAIEFNSGLTFPACLDNVLGKRTPSKKSNKRVLALEDRIPVVANDDAHSEKDMRKGASTSYNVVSGLPLIDSIFDTIRRRDFSMINRRLFGEKYAPLLSPVWHMLDIEQSEKLSRQGKLIEY